MVSSYTPCEYKLKSITFPRLNIVFKLKIKGLVPFQGILLAGVVEIGRQRRIGLFEITSNSGQNPLPITGHSRFLATYFKGIFVSKTKWVPHFMVMSLIVVYKHQ